MTLYTELPLFNPWLFRVGPLMYPDIAIDYYYH